MGHFMDKIQGKQNESVAAEYALRLMYGQSGLLPGHQVKPEETSMEGMKSALDAISTVFHVSLPWF